MSGFAKVLPILTASIVFLPAQAVYGQATRTWVSGAGNDANPCSRTAPCKTFAGALSKTPAGGEIDAMDSGGFGGLTITKSITIDGSAGVGGVLVPGNGIVVNAGPNDVVVLKGLIIDGGRSGAIGIQLIQASSVVIEDCQVFSFTTRNISVEPAASPMLVYISNTRVHNSLSNGIVVAPGGEFPSLVTLNKVEIMNNVNYGLSAAPIAFVMARDSIISGNGSTNSLSNIRADDAWVHLDNVTVTGGNLGILAVDNSYVAVNNSTISMNITGLIEDGGTIYSFGNNRLVGNGTDGTFSTGVSLQ